MWRRRSRSSSTPKSTVGPCRPFDGARGAGPAAARGRFWRAVLQGRGARRTTAGLATSPGLGSDYRVGHDPISRQTGRQRDHSPRTTPAAPMVIAAGGRVSVFAVAGDGKQRPSRWERRAASAGLDLRPGRSAMFPRSERAMPAIGDPPGRERRKRLACGGPSGGAVFWARNGPAPWASSRRQQCRQGPRRPSRARALRNGSGVGGQGAAEIGPGDRVRAGRPQPAGLAAPVPAPWKRLLRSWPR